MELVLQTTEQNSEKRINVPFGEWLVSQGYLTDAQLVDALKN